MPKTKKPFNLVRKIVVQLRAIHRGWPNANQCLKKAKITKKDFRCEICLLPFRKPCMKKDHIKPIGEEPQLINGSWVPTWDSYINSVFSPLENYQALCEDCHQLKTTEEKKKIARRKKTK